MRIVLTCGILLLATSSVVFAMFEAIVTQMETVIKNSDKLNTENLKVKRFNRTTFVIDGTFELFTDKIDDWDTKCEVYRKMGNEFKLLPYKVGPTNVCKMLKDEKMLYPDIVANSENFPPVGTCDFKSGVVYKVNNYLPDLSKVPPVFESGDYMVECQALRNGQVLQTLKVIGQVYNIKDAKPKPPF